MPNKPGDRGGGFLDGLSTLVEKLGDLAEKGEQIKKSGGFTSGDKKVKGSYGVQIGVGPGKGGQEEQGPRIEPVAKPPEQRTRARAGERVREPPVDVFEEEGGLLIVAEMPGVECGDIVLELRGEVLAIRAEHEDFRYDKEIELPRHFAKEQVKATCRNGILEVRLNDEKEDEAS